MGHGLNIRATGAFKRRAGRRAVVSKPELKMVRHSSATKRSAVEEAVSRGVEVLEKLVKGDVRSLDNVILNEHQKQALRSNPHANTSLTKKQIKKLQRRALITTQFLAASESICKMETD
jgi:hypothetical protein